MSRQPQPQPQPPRPRGRLIAYSLDDFDPEAADFSRRKKTKGEGEVGSDTAAAYAQSAPGQQQQQQQQQHHEGRGQDKGLMQVATTRHHRPPDKDIDSGMVLGSNAGTLARGIGADASGPLGRSIDPFQGPYMHGNAAAVSSSSRALVTMSSAGAGQGDGRVATIELDLQRELERELERERVTVVQNNNHNVWNVNMSPGEAAGGGGRGGEAQGEKGGSNGTGAANGRRPKSSSLATPPPNWTRTAFRRLLQVAWGRCGVRACWVLALVTVLVLVGVGMAQQLAAIMPSFSPSSRPPPAASNVHVATQLSRAPSAPDSLPLSHNHPRAPAALVPFSPGEKTVLKAMLEVSDEADRLAYNQGHLQRLHVQWELHAMSSSTSPPPLGHGRGRGHRHRHHQGHQLPDQAILQNAATRLHRLANNQVGPAIRWFTELEAQKRPLAQELADVQTAIAGVFGMQAQGQTQAQAQAQAQAQTKFQPRPTDLVELLARSSHLADYAKSRATAYKLAIQAIVDGVEEMESLASELGAECHAMLVARQQGTHFDDWDPQHRLRRRAGVVDRQSNDQLRKTKRAARDKEDYYYDYDDDQNQCPATVDLQRGVYEAAWWVCVAVVGGPARAGSGSSRPQRHDQITGLEKLRSFAAWLAKDSGGGGGGGGGGLSGAGQRQAGGDGPGGQQRDGGRPVAGPLKRAWRSAETAEKLRHEIQAEVERRELRAAASWW